MQAAAYSRRTCVAPASGSGVRAHEPLRHLMQSITALGEPSQAGFMPHWRKEGRGHVWETAEFTAQYAQRAGIEGTQSQAIRRCGLRQCRYVGHAKTIPSEYPAYLKRTPYSHGDGD
jgi:hypothetical protein